MRKSLWIIALVLVAATAAPNAHADTFNFTVTGGVSGMGTFTTNPLSGGTYLITGITGTFDGAPITSLIAVIGFGGNDNLLYPAPPYLDGGGVSFNTPAGTHTQWNLFESSPTTYAAFYDHGGGSLSGPTVALGITVPEPGAGLLTLIGIGSGWVMRKRISLGI